MEVSVLTEKHPQWNEVSVHPLVSWEWGEARAAMGIDVVRIGCFQGGQLAETYQMTLHPIPHTGMTVGYVPRTMIPSPEAFEVIEEEARKRKAVFVKLEPYVSLEDTQSGSVAERYEGLLDKATRSAHPLFPKWTQMLDLTPSEDDLFAALKPKWRYNVNLARRKGVEVREMTTDEGFEMFAKLYFDTTQRQDYAGHTKHYHETIFKHVRNSMSHILVAFYNGTPLSAYHLFHFNNVLYYPYGGSSPLHRDVMASNLLMWEAIVRGKRLGAQTFDMWGSMAPDYDASAGGWAGFTRFKEGYGTRFVEFVGTYDIVLNPVLYRVYGVADVIRKKFLM